MGVVLASLVLGPSARGRDLESGVPPTVAIVCRSTDRFGLRLVAEFEALGLRAVVVEPAEPPSRDTLEAMARHEGAIAAIRAVPSERGAEVWVADRVTGKTVIREMVGGSDTPDGEAALALRVVELLRASLLEASSLPTSAGEVPATAEIDAKLQVPVPGAPIERPPLTVRLSLAPAVLASPGGFPPTASLDFGLTWMPGEHVGFSVFAAIPLTSARITRAEGNIDLSVPLLGAALRFAFNPAVSRLRPFVDLGVADVWIQTIDIASAGFLASSPSANTAAPFARIGVTWELMSTLRLRADVLVSAIVQGVSIQADGRDIASWGRPLVLSCAGVDFAWF